MAYYRHLVIHSTRVTNSRVVHKLDNEMSRRITPSKVPNDGSAVAPRYRLGPNDSSNSGNTIEMPSVIHTRR